MLSLLTANGKPDKPWANRGKARIVRDATTGQRKQDRNPARLANAGRAPHGRTRAGLPDQCLAAVPPDA